LITTLVNALTTAGLSVENLKLLFKEGVQFNANKLQAGGGSGLGLFIAKGASNLFVLSYLDEVALFEMKGIVELHGGTISASSLGLGKGATFTIQLPVVEVLNLTRNEIESLHDDRNESAEVLFDCDAKKSISKVMVVDDAPTNRKMLCRFVCELSFIFTNIP